MILRLAAIALTALLGAAIGALAATSAAFVVIALLASAGGPR